MKILLILAASRTDPLRRSDPYMPLSLPLLAATAPEHEYRFVDLLRDDDVDYGAPVDLVGISMRCPAEGRAYEIAGEFRRRGVKVVLGGAQASVVPFRAIEHADAVAVGEGEPLWPVIVRHAQENRLRHFYVCSPRPFNAQGHTLHQESGFADLAAVPRPLRHLMGRRYTFETVFAARGCPMDCDFCSVTRLFGPQYRFRPVDSVVADIGSITARYFYLLDDTVFGRPGSYDYYLDLYRRLERQPRRKYWTGQANLGAAGDPTGRDVIKAAARAGLLHAAVGMESVNPATLAESGAMVKMGTADAGDVVQRMKERIRFIQDQGIVVSGWFVIGYENDDVETYERTVDFCDEMNVIPAISPVKALPGTRLYERLKREGRLNETRRLNVVHPRMSEDAVWRAFSGATRRAYSAGRILRRSLFYVPRFRRDRIHGMIFAAILQAKMGKGLTLRETEFRESAS